MFRFFKGVSIHDLFLALASDEVRHPPLIFPENSQYDIIKAYFNTTIGKIKKNAQNGLGGIDEDKLSEAIIKITSVIPGHGVTPQNLDFLLTLANLYNDTVNSLIEAEEQAAAVEQIYNFDLDENDYDVMKARDILQHHEIGRELAWAMAATISARLKNAPQVQEDAPPSSRGCILQ